MRSIVYNLLIFLVLGSGGAFTLADGETTRDLDGTRITYDYTNGRSYNVKFEKEGVSYRYLTGSKPNTWWGPFPYQAMKVSDQLYFASWFEEGYGDYVTLLINFDENIIHGSAIIRGEDVHFHRAKLVNIERP